MPSFSTDYPCAALLSDTSTPTNIRSLLSAIYEVRSAIVHGGSSIEEALKRKSLRSLDPPAASASDLVKRTESVVRSVIREYIGLLSENKSIGDINRDLDTAITDGLVKPTAADKLSR